MRASISQKGPIARGMRGLIAVYRACISPFLGHGCRHEPSCSRYADQAIARFGAWAGGWMALARLSRCRPGGSRGFDPVPNRLERQNSALAPWRYGEWSPRKAMSRTQALFETAPAEKTKVEETKDGL